MRFLFTTFVAFCSVLVLAGAFLAFLAVEKEPLVKASPQLAAYELGRVKGILEKHDPRNMKAGTIRTLTLTESELTLVANHLLNYYGTGVADVRLGQQSVVLKASLRVPDGGWGYFLNLQATAAPVDGVLRVKALRVGRLPVPEWLAELMVKMSLRLVVEGAPAKLIQSVGISQEGLDIVYQWRPELLDTVRRHMFPEAEAIRLRAFNDRLVQLTAAQGTRKRLSMKWLLAGLFEFAAARLNESPVADNLAILIILGAYVNNKSLDALVPEASNWPIPKRLTLTLAGRKDLARHFLTSAALAVTGGGFLSDTVGVYKEIADSKKGSGFSFTDLAADRAGTRFAELATNSPQSATRLWQVFAGSIEESDFMPSVKDLPELMSETVFHARFGIVGSPAYNRLAQEIEQRIAALSLYRRG